MARFANVELKQLDQLLKEKNSQNTHRSSDVAWDVWKSYTANKNIVVDPKTILKKCETDTYKIQLEIVHSTSFLIQ